MEAKKCLGGNLMEPKVAAAGGGGITGLNRDQLCDLRLGERRAPPRELPLSQVSNLKRD